MNSLALFVLGINVFYLVIRGYFYYQSFTRTIIIRYLFITLSSACIHGYLDSSGRPSAKKSNISVLDLQQPGAVEYMIDYVYICNFILIIGVFTDWAYTIWWIIPSYALYKLITLVQKFFSARKNLAGSSENGNSGTSKRQAKLQKRAEKGDRRLTKIQN